MASKKVVVQQNDAFLYGLIGLLTGAVLMLLLIRGAVTSGSRSVMQMAGLDREEVNMMEERRMGMTDNSDEMMESLGDKTGVALERAFLSAMIVHHQSAISMANLVKDSERKELRDLANSIIKTQGEEIELMQTWLSMW